jgi:hypothetical protein
MVTNKMKYLKNKAWEQNLQNNLLYSFKSIFVWENKNFDDSATLKAAYQFFFVVYD